MPSEADRLAVRLEQFSTRVMTFIPTLPKNEVGQEIADQLARCGPGIGSNHRSARRARSRAEFISRLAVALDEADESEYWLSATKSAGVAAGSEVEWLLDESRQLRAILAASVATARRNHETAKRAKEIARRSSKRRPAVRSRHDR